MRYVRNSPLMMLDSYGLDITDDCFDAGYKKCYEQFSIWALPLRWACYLAVSVRCMAAPQNKERKPVVLPQEPPKPQPPKPQPPVPPLKKPKLSHQELLDKYCVFKDGYYSPRGVVTADGCAFCTIWSKQNTLLCQTCCDMALTTQGTLNCCNTCIGLDQMMGPMAEFINSVDDIFDGFGTIGDLLNGWRAFKQIYKIP